MIDKAERVFDSLHRADIVRLLALDHDYRDTQRTGGCDLTIGGRAAAVLGDDDVDPVAGEKGALGGFLKGAGRQNVARIGYAELRQDGIDAADQILVLRRMFEMEDLLPANGEKDTFWRRAKRRNRLRNGTDAGPEIAGLLFPGEAAKRKKCNAGAACRNRRIVRDARRKGMGGVDQKVEIFRLQKTGKPVAATEAAAAARHRLSDGFRRSPGERQENVAVRAESQRGCQLPCFGRAAKDQDTVFAHG